MSTKRALLLIVLFSALALSLLAIRAEQTRLAARAVNLEMAQVTARRELWDAQAEVARLRTPNQIENRLERLDLDVGPINLAQPPRQTMVSR